MSEPIDLDAKRSRRPKPLQARDIVDFHGREIPSRDWLIPSVLLRRSITLLAGDGGVGKSLLCQQLQVAAALGIDWLGLPIGNPMASLAIYCEDDEDELHRRYWDICRHYNCNFKDIERRVFFLCGVGEDDNELIEFRGKGDYGRPTKTDRFLQVMELVKDYEIQLTILDTISDVFAGNENIRYQVKAFVTAIRGLSLIGNGGVIMTSHPSKSAMVDGSGFSGSTAWNGAVRNRLYLTAKRTKDEEGDTAPTDDRALKIMKSNYGPFGEKIRLRWQDGVFIRTDMERSSVLDRIDACAKLLDAARYFIERGTFLAATSGTRTSLTTLAKTLENCSVFSSRALISAQDKLISDGRFVLVNIGPASKCRTYIRPRDMTYPGEIS